MSTMTDLQKSSYPISATAWSTLLCLQNRPDDMENLACTDYLRFAATELGFIAITLIGTIETIFWASILLLAKAIHVFIPESQIADRIFTQIFVSTAFTLGTTAGAASLIVYNFSTDPYITCELDDSINDMGTSFTENYLMSLINYRLFTDTVILKPREE